MSVRAVVLALAVAAFAVTSSLGGASPRERPEASAPPVSKASARRIAAVWGNTLTLLPTWAPLGVVPSHWWSVTCACGTDDNLLTVQFLREKTRLDWEVSDEEEIDRRGAGITCQSGRFAARVIHGRTVFYRPASDTAWICIPIPAGARWYPSIGNPIIAPLGKMTISVRQVAGRLRANDLQRMAASAQPFAPPGRTSSSRYELPPQNQVRRMATAFGRPLLLPRMLPGGFIYSDWNVRTGREPRDSDRRRVVEVSFGRDSLFSQIIWNVSSGVDTLGLDCPRQARPSPQAVINGRGIYANEGIHGVSVWTCIPPDVVRNARPLEVSMWYDIRLHNATMLRLAMRIIGTAQLVHLK